MNVLLIGGGGREHALAKAILRSPKLTRLEVAPGNAGTPEHNLQLAIADHIAVIERCRTSEMDLVVIGPEAPLVAGLADDLTAAGIACFGPSAAGARLEGSESFARGFAARHDIPIPVTAAFTE
ncbi:MAG: phosphoribosylamine--glycine ligase, partial [Acidimicrobiales bacterium]